MREEFRRHIPKRRSSESYIPVNRCHDHSCVTPKGSGSHACCQKRGPADQSWPVPLGEMSNRGHCSDSEQFISICKDLQEHGRHPKSLQDSLRHRYCVLRCVPRPEGNRSYGSPCLDRICVPRQRRRNKRSEGTVRTFLCDRRYASNAVATANTLARLRVFSPLDNQ